MKYVVMLIYSFSLFPLFASAHDLVRYRWNKNVQINMEQELTPLSGRREKIHRGHQMLGPAKIAGTWLQLVDSSSGERIFGSGNYYSSTPVELLPKLNAMALRTPSMSRTMIDRDHELQSAHKVFPAILEIAWNEELKKFIPYWLIDYVDKNQKSFYFVKVNEQLQIMARGATGVSDADGEARVYPAGPRYSEISDEAMTGMSNKGTLESAKIQVESAMGVRVFAPDLRFLFAPDDMRFPPVQVYYYVNKALNWFQSELSAELPQQLQVQVQIGDNGISNAAFYHAYTVYLGTGDGILYKDMLKDPSIVVHETAHAFVDAYAGLPVDGEGGSLNEGFADLFACLLLDSPNVGEVSYVPGPYRRTIKEELRVQDFNKGLYHDGDIMAATIWELREHFGRDTASHIAFRTLVRLGAGATFKDFLPAVSAAIASELQGSDYQYAMGVITKRGWATISP